MPDVSVLEPRTGIAPSKAYRVEMARSTALGQFLRARRELVRPEDTGLHSLGRRRVPGLRREEVASLAGISAEYYLRLERGRDQRPSVEVVNALSGALQLDEDATAHLHSLARPARTAREPRERELVPASIERLISAWPETPALVHGRHMDVLAANELCRALLPGVSPGVNVISSIFLDPGMRNLYPRWEDVARHSVARLRGGCGVGDRRLADLVSELSVRSVEFRRLWARHDIRVTPAPSEILNHPIVGSLQLEADRLAIIGTSGQVLVVYQASPGGQSEQALALLAGLADSDNR